MIRRVVLCASLLYASPLHASASYFQCPDGTPPPCRAATAIAATPAANSVAVLLFNNVMRDTAVSYLGDGLASEIATSLAGVQRLEVRSPGLVRQVQRGAASDPRLLGRRLGVRYVVEGDYQRGGDRIRVSVRLVTVASGVQRWSSAYTRPANDMLAVQEDVAREVATSIAGQLLPQERTAIAAHATTNPEAWDHLLRGNFAMARRTQEGVTRAIDEFQAASRIDPRFARAEAMRALAYALVVDWGWQIGLTREELLRRGLDAADRALALDTLSSDGWMARGYLLSERVPVADYTEVLADFDRSIRLDPRNAEALHQLASKYAELGAWQEAIDTERRALAIDPDRPVSQWLLGDMLRELDRDDDALRAFDSSMSLAWDPLESTCRHASLSIL